MRPILFAGIALFVCVAGRLTSADSPNDSVAREFAEIQKKFETEQKALKKKLASAEDAGDKKQIAFAIKEMTALAASDAVDLAAAHPKDEAGLEAAVFALKLLCEFRLFGRDWDKGVAVVLDNHIDNPKIQGALAPMSAAGPRGKRLLETVAEKTTKKEIQGLAFYYIAQAQAAESTQHELEGFNVSGEKLRAQAVETLEKALKLAPEAKIGADTLAKIVATELVSLKIGVGNPLPEVEGVDLDGKKVKLSSLKGRVVLLDFWATWCGPCLKMIPHERELADKLSKKGFVLLSVSVDEERSTVTEFMAKQKMPWSHWWDGRQGPVAKLFRVHGFPTLFLIDAKGIVRKKWVGAAGDEVIDKAIQDVLAQGK
jgi:thiol-disulfide isomerase/thioredoxin